MAINNEEASRIVKSRGRTDAATVVSVNIRRTGCRTIFDPSRDQKKSIKEENIMKSIPVSGIDL